MSPTFWQRLLYSGSSKSLPRRRQVHWKAPLRIDPLENRVVPVVGALAVSPAVAAGTGFDGVALVTTQTNGTCSGSLLYTAQHVLTAAHCVDNDVDIDGDGRVDQGDGTVDPGVISLAFTLPSGTITLANIPSASIALPAGWNGITKSGTDFAIISLSEIAPYGAERYELYRNNNEVGQNFTIVGYGRTGTGANGNQPFTSGTKRSGQNRWDGDANLLGGNPVNVVGIMPVGIGLAYDFDNGNAANDAFGTAFAINDTGLGAAEACQGPGDSGGPAFIGNQISAVVSFSRQRYANPPDVDGVGNNSFGEFAVMTRVSAFAGVIDAMLTGPYDLTLDLANQPVGNDGAADSIVARTSDGSLELVVNGQVWHTELLNRVQSLTLQGSGDRDTITIAEILPFPVHVDGGGGNNTLTVTGSSGGDTVEVTASAVTMGNQSVSYTGLGRVTVNTNAGNDSIFVRSSSIAVEINAGENNDTITVGSGGANSALDAIQGGLTILGGGGQDVLNLYDQGTQAGRTYTITSLNVERSDAATILYLAVENVAIHTGNLSNTINLQSILANTSVTINSGTSNDTINLGSAGNSLSSLVGNTTLVDRGGQDQLNFNDQGSAVARNYTVSVGGLTRDGAGSMNYLGIETVSLNGSGFNDVVNVTGTSAGTQVLINTGSGTDTLVAANSNNTWRLTAVNEGTLTGALMPGSVYYLSVENLTGGTAKDTYIFSRGGGVSGTIVGGNGADTLDYSAFTLDVRVSLVTGIASAVGGSISSVENVIGGSGHDVLIGNDLDNQLNGGGGRNLLIGGRGKDQLSGGADEDILIGGSLRDTSDLALAAIMAEWTRSDLSYSKRINNLTKGGGLNGDYRLRAEDVLNDNVSDRLSGSAGLDWYFSDDLDEAVLSSGERRN